MSSRRGSWLEMKNLIISAEMVIFQRENSGNLVILFHDSIVICMILWSSSGKEFSTTKGERERDSIFITQEESHLKLSTDDHQARLYDPQLIPRESPSDVIIPGEITSRREREGIWSSQNRSDSTKSLSLDAKCYQFIPVHRVLPDLTSSWRWSSSFSSSSSSFLSSIILFLPKPLLLVQKSSWWLLLRLSILFIPYVILIIRFRVKIRSQVDHRFQAKRNPMR